MIHNEEQIYDGNKLISFTYFVEGSRDWVSCEKCAHYVIDNWELVKREGFDEWLVDPCKYESEIRITQNFSNAQLVENGCDLCLDRLN